ncbi:hypothetical protein J3459_011423 [Metarhizium acridum]|uniref:uncharacterized protein n=1 Tax=Metarhizium acridum TaxID=92637 RepID=UPI001C6B1201|nr:hypothetical protein J3458_009218 [Metarhizium acridum]KAG8420064.1 hypothetical protein J3459_011423 [Metarhizium acridum]
MEAVMLRDMHGVCCVGGWRKLWLSAPARILFYANGVFPMPSCERSEVGNHGHLEVMVDVTLLSDQDGSRMGGEKDLFWLLVHIDASLTALLRWAIGIPTGTALYSI